MEIAGLNLYTSLYVQAVQKNDYECQTCWFL